MSGSGRRLIAGGSLLVAAVVALATVLAAFREHDLGPVVGIGWLPAVLAAALWSPTRGRCGHGPGERA